MANEITHGQWNTHIVGHKIQAMRLIGNRWLQIRLSNDEIIEVQVDTHGMNSLPDDLELSVSLKETSDWDFQGQA